MRFRAIVIPSGNATGVEVPDAVMDALGGGTRPPITITINGHTWRSRIALMRGQRLVGISAANRAAAGIAQGDNIEVALELDTEPRIIDQPADLALALSATPAAKGAFDSMPFGLKRKHVAAIEEAKSSEVRQRRIESLVARLATAKG